MTSEQIRAASAMLRLERAALAGLAGVSTQTIKRLEGMDGPLIDTRVATLEAIRSALETAGVEFIPENGGGAGVRLRKPRED